MVNVGKYTFRPMDPIGTVDGSEIWRENRLGMVLKTLYTSWDINYQPQLVNAGVLNHERYVHQKC